MKKLEEYIMSIPDFPKPGIIFRDVTTVSQDPVGFKLAIDELQKIIDGIDFDVVVGLEARGFVFGAPVAYNLGKSFVLVRKKGKLPRETITEKYSLEYGEAQIELHVDAIEKGQKVVIFDDLLATGGTAKAATKLVEKLGGEVAAVVFLIELEGLQGRKNLDGYKVLSAVKYKGA